MAEPILVYNTGNGPNGFGEASEGSWDLNWNLVLNPDSLYAGATAFIVKDDTDSFEDGYMPAGWTPNDGTSRWLSNRQAPKKDRNEFGFASASTGMGWIGSAQGDYAYQTTFDLTGFDSSTARIQGRWLSDGDGIAVLLNGVSILSGASVVTNYNLWGAFDLTNGFNDGINTLTFMFHNERTNPFGPAGLRVEFTSTEVSEISQVPEPGTIFLAAFGLAALVPFRRRLR